MPLPEKTRQHIERTQKEAQEWKRKYHAEIGSLRYERNAWRQLATHMRDCVLLDDCEECENLWAIAAKEQNGNRAVHSLSQNCWCEPRQDDEVPTLWGFTMKRKQPTNSLAIALCHKCGLSILNCCCYESMPPTAEETMSLMRAVKRLEEELKESRGFLSEWVGMPQPEWFERVTAFLEKTEKKPAP